MKFLKPEPGLAPYELQAMTMVARAGRNGLARPQRAMLDAVQKLLLETELDVDDLRPITARELAAHVDDPAQGRQLVRLMVAMSLADGPPSPEQVDLLAAFAHALDVREPAVGVLRPLAKGRLLLFRLAFFRHSHIRVYLRNTYRQLGGLPAMIRSLLIMRGVLAEDTERAARFRALEELPEDTLGYRFFRHYTGAGLAFPGETGGFPVGALFHDFAHVLAGYDTSPEGEMKTAAFQAGFMRYEDDFFVALFALVIHTAGINLAPFPMPVLPGRIGQGTLAMDVFLALRRGAATKVDLSDDWDFWEYVVLPIDVARERLGIPPLTTAPAAM